MAQAARSKSVATVGDDIATAEVPVFGEKFRIKKGQNLFNLLLAFDEEQPSRLPKYLIDVIHPDDRKRFITAMAQQAELTADDLLDIFTAVTEAQADGHPTDSSSGSPASSAKKQASRRSAVG